MSQRIRPVSIIVHPRHKVKATRQRRQRQAVGRATPPWARRAPAKVREETEES
jgi:hypothetical protein